MTAPFPAVPDLPAHVVREMHDHDLHFHPHGYVRPPELSRGRCTWRWDAYGAAILCWAYDMPPRGLCVHHAALDPTADVVTFPPTALDAGTLQIAGDAGVTG